MCSYMCCHVQWLCHAAVGVGCWGDTHNALMCFVFFPSRVTTPIPDKKQQQLARLVNHATFNMLPTLHVQIIVIIFITQYCCLQHCIFIKLCDNAATFNTGSFELVHISSREFFWLHTHYWSALLFFLHGCINLY